MTEPNLDNPTTPSSTGLRNQIGKYFWCSRMDCNEGHIMYCDDETDQYYELDQCKCNQGVEEILALIANQVREARIDEVNRIPNPAYIDSATGLRQEPNQQYKIDRLAQLKGEDK